MKDSPFDDMRGRDAPRWRLAEVTDELNARPFPEFSLPTRIFRLCVKGREAYASVQAALSAVLDGVDWDVAEQGKLIRGVYHNVRVNIERHTEFTSITLIEESQDTQSLASALPTGWTAGISGDIVVAVDCNVRARDTQTARQWVCASALEGGRATAYFNFRVADDGHTKILLEFAPDCDPRDIGRVSLQVLEIETYRCFAALGLPVARAAQQRLWEIADMIPSAPPDLDNQSEASERFQILSKLAGELEEIWRDTSFRFNACFAYWGLVQARLASLGEAAYDARISVGGFLERRLGPAVTTYESTARQRDDLADQVEKLSTVLQTRIELDLQRQNAELLHSLNSGTERQLRLQQTVEGVSVVAISYYAVNLLVEPVLWLMMRLPLPFAPGAGSIKAALVVLVIPAVWLAVRRLLRATVGRH
ncbi:MAG: DUF3422 domain-containing protein [Rhodobiaceae bacterium]